MTLVRLPVAGVDVGVRAPAGADDLFLLEAGPLDLRVALAFLARLADAEDFDPAALPIGDLDVILLRLRQRLLGDAVNAHEVCAAPGCGARVDIAFSIGAYLAHHVPEVPADVIPAGERGWYRFSDLDVELRIPRAADQLAIEDAEDPEAALLARCVRPSAATTDERVRDRVEAAMEAMAPSLCSELAGTCPSCGASVATLFDPVHYMLRELAARATYIYDDVCAIAHHFHWSEAEILALPAPRRARYADLAARHALGRRP
jgi:hypothetical protein